MERGNLRCDANVSLRPRGSGALGTRTETKNVNSLRSVERAVRYEIQRQAAILAAGGTIIQETRHWHEDTGTTSRRAAEERRGRLPLLPGARPAAGRSRRAELIEELRAALPEPPTRRRKRLQADWGFTDLEFQDVVERGLLVEVEATVAAGAAPAAARKWWTGEIAAARERAAASSRARWSRPQHVAELVALVEDGTLTDRLARQVLEGVIAGEGTPAGGRRRARARGRLRRRRAHRRDRRGARRAARRAGRRSATARCRPPARSSAR